MTKKIYLVCGGTGEYSDATEWRVAAYVQKELAEKHRDLAQADCVRLRKEAATLPDIRDRLALENKYDKENCSGYTSGVEYWVEDVFWCDENEYEHV